MEHIQKRNIIHLLILIIACSYLIQATLTIYSAEAQTNQTNAMEIILRLQKSGKLYQDYTELKETEKQILENELTIEEQYLFMKLLKYDFIHGFTALSYGMEQLDFYIFNVEKLRIMEFEPMEEINKKVINLLTESLPEADQVKIADYDMYDKHLFEVYGGNMTELLGFMEAVYQSEETEYEQVLNALKNYVENTTKKQGEPPVEAPIPAAIAEENPEKEIYKGEILKDEVSGNGQEITAPQNAPQYVDIPNTQLPLSRNAVFMSVKAATGYHTESCGRQCVTEICAGATFTKNLGQWYEVCGVCERGGHTNNNWFNVTIALDEYYACKHLGEIITGSFRYGNCVKFGGSAELDSRKYLFRHDVSFCPGHEQPNTYLVSYESNGGTGFMGNSAYIYDKASNLEKNKYSKEGNRFLGWSLIPGDSKPTFADGAEVKNLTADDRGTVTLHAVWQEVIAVTYKGNGAVSGNEQREEVIISNSNGSYEIKPNTSFTSFTKPGYIFVGWGKFETVSSYDSDYYSFKNLPAVVTHEELRAIAKVQKKQENNSKALTASFYAVWDEIPKLKANGVLEFYEGEVVTKEMLLANIAVMDQEASDRNIPLQVRITELQYSDGKLVDGKPAALEQLLWSEDMPKDYVLDTWFLQLDKKDSPVTHKIIYEVTDDFGNSTSLEWAIKVKYNEFPEIKTKDRYFTVEEAQNGKVTIDELQTQMTATDTEDGDVTPKLKLIGFAEEEFLAFQESGYVVLNATVTDSYGKETVRQFTINIIKDGEVKKNPEAKYLRFINKGNYEKNVAIDSEQMTEQDIKESSANGGMKATSIWYTDKEYRNLIKATLSNELLLETWIFSKEDIKDVKNSLKLQGPKDSQKEENLIQFLTRFGKLRQ